MMLKLEEGRETVIIQIVQKITTFAYTWHCHIVYTGFNINKSHLAKCPRWFLGGT